LENSCFHSVQNLQCALLSKILKIKIYITIILPGHSHIFEDNIKLKLRETGNEDVKGTEQAQDFMNVVMKLLVL
jgi:hypothetical protein